MITFALSLCLFGAMAGIGSHFIGLPSTTKQSFLALAVCALGFIGMGWTIINFLG